MRGDLVDARDSIRPGLAGRAVRLEHSPRVAHVHARDDAQDAGAAERRPQVGGSRRSGAAGFSSSSREARVLRAGNRKGSRSASPAGSGAAASAASRRGGRAVHDGAAVDHAAGSRFPGGDARQHLSRELFLPRHTSMSSELRFAERDPCCRCRAAWFRRRSRRAWNAPPSADFRRRDPCSAPAKVSHRRRRA